MWKGAQKNYILSTQAVDFQISFTSWDGLNGDQPDYLTEVKFYSYFEFPASEYKFVIEKTVLSKELSYLILFG